MKRFTTILLATMLSLAAFAQGGTKDLWHDKSTRGFELTLKGFVAPWGGYYENLEEPSRHFKDVGGGAAGTISYRINKCLSIGASWEFILTNNWHGCPSPLAIIPMAGNIKYNYLEREKFSPYISITVGFDACGGFNNGMSDDYTYMKKPNYDRYPDSGYPPDPNYFHVSPSLGFDFPVAKWCTLFTEVRADWIPDDSFMLSVGAGVTFALHKKKNK